MPAPIACGVGDGLDGVVKYNMPCDAFDDIAEVNNRPEALHFARIGKGDDNEGDDSARHRLIGEMKKYFHGLNEAYLSPARYLLALAW